MNWSASHNESERLANEADLARRRGDIAAAEASFSAAGRAEARALRALGPHEPRTYGITAMSAAALFFKGGEFAEAEKVAREALEASFLPDFARDQIEEILQAIELHHERRMRM